ncbi:MAG: zinc ribbon domain-containing protein [Zestosphaera sp.]
MPSKVEDYPKHIAQNSDKSSKINFEVVHIWTYKYLLMRITEIGEEHGIRVEFVSEENTSTICPLCIVKNQDHRRVYRGLFKCYKHSKVFNADLCGVGVTRLRPGAELNPAKAGNVAPNLPETLALQGGEEVRILGDTI